MRKPSLRGWGLWPALVWPGASPISGLQPASPGGLRRCQLTQRELCGGPGRHVWVCVYKAVYLGVPLCGTVSPGQECVSGSHSVFQFSCLNVPFCLCIPTAMFGELSVSVSPSLNVSVCLLCVSFLSQSIFLCISESVCPFLPLSVCMGLLCLPVFFLSCMSLCPYGRVSPLLCVCVVRASHVPPSLCPVFLCVSVWVSVSLSPSLGL